MLTYIRTNVYVRLRDCSYEYVNRDVRTCDYISYVCMCRLFRIGTHINSLQLYASRGRNEKEYREFVMLLEQLHCKGLTAPV